MASSEPAQSINPLLESYLRNPKQLEQLLNYAQSFPNFPKNFTPPWLFDPHYVPPDRGPVLIFSTICLSAIMLVIVIARLAVRRFWKKQAWGLDDWWIIPAALLATGLTAEDVYNVSVNGSGRHSFDRTYVQLARGYKTTLIQTLLYFWTTLCIKLSILSVYLRIFPTDRTGYRQSVTCLTVILTLTAFVATFLVLFGCRPMKALWDLDAFLSPHKSIDLEKLLTALSAIYAVQDVAIFILPIPVVWSLQIPLRERLHVLALFGIGGFTCIACLARTVLIYRVVDDWDRAYKGVWVLIVSNAECTGGIICASLPALSSFVRMMLVKYNFMEKTAVGSAYESYGKGLASGSKTDKPPLTPVQSLPLTGRNAAMSFLDSNSSIGSLPLHHQSSQLCHSPAGDSIEMQTRAYQSHEIDGGTLSGQDVV